jgi:F-type H+-transporting ATPase subunit epsilon
MSPIDVHVVTPERELWSGEADTVIARGIDGEVGILAGHAPLMVQLAIGPLRIQRANEGEIVAVVDGGFLHVTSVGVDQGDAGTRVDVLAANAELTGDIDVGSARARAEELEQQLAQDRDTQLDEAELEHVHAELRKAQARIDLAG